MEALPVSRCAYDLPSPWEVSGIQVGRMLWIDVLDFPEKEPLPKTSRSLDSRAIVRPRLRSRTTSLGRDRRRVRCGKQPGRGHFTSAVSNGPVLASVGMFPQA